jgi:hypothetical protein
MARKHLKFLLILLMLTSPSGVIFFYLTRKSEQSSQETTKSYFVKQEKDPTIRGFRLSGYHQRQKAITILAGNQRGYIGYSVF